MIESVDLAAWAKARARGSRLSAVNDVQIAEGVRLCLTLLADPNTPDVDAVLAHLEARRRAILRKEAGEVGR